MSLSNIELYGFSGKLGSGKNFVAENLFLPMLPKKPTLVMAMADQLKVNACTKNGIAYEKIFIKKDEVSRRSLQEEGTLNGRAKYGENYWIDTLETWIRTYHDRGIERFIVTDLRFKNEVDWLKKMGGQTFRIEAPNRNRDQLDQESEGDAEKRSQIQNHPSETDVDGYDQFDYIINNDYEDQPKVANRIRDIVREVKTKKPRPLTIFCDMDDTICMCARFYQEITIEVMSRIRQKTCIDETVLKSLLDKHVFSYEKRYYTWDDFGRSLTNLAVEAFLVKGKTLELSEVFLNEIYQLGLGVYDHDYDPLYEDSLDRVRQMRQFGQVVIFTLGDHTEQMKKIANLGLLDFPIEICTHKDENMFRHLQAKYPAEQYVMIGDSYYRDIVPASLSGIRNLVHINRTGAKPKNRGIPDDEELRRLEHKLMEAESDLSTSVSNGSTKRRLELECQILPNLRKEIQRMTDQVQQQNSSTSSITSTTDQVAPRLQQCDSNSTVLQIDRLNDHLMDYLSKIE